MPSVYFLVLDPVLRNGFIIGYILTDRFATPSIIRDLPAEAPAMVARQFRWRGPLSALGRNPGLHLPMLHKDDWDSTQGL